MYWPSQSNVLDIRPKQYSHWANVGRQLGVNSPVQSARRRHSSYAVDIVIYANLRK